MAYDSSNLPPVGSQALSSTQLSSLMPRKVLTLLEKNPPSDVFFAVKTGSGIDVGAWSGTRRIWVCCCDQELLLLAAGRQDFVERAPYTQLRESHYNHVTASLLLAPASFSVDQLRLKPSDALQILAYINN